MAENSESPHRGVVTRRWTEQRWLIDNVIRSVGVDWDQPRTVSYNAPCGPEANADFAAIREKVKKYADIAPAFEATARRREAKARARLRALGRREHDDARDHRQQQADEGADLVRERDELFEHAPP